MPRAHQTVCIVDDDSALRNALALEFSTQGYAVREFADGEALMDCPSLPDAACLVVDHRLPRLDGLYVIEALRARGVRTPAILITSNPAATLRRRCDSLGIPLVEKPLIEDELSRAVSDAFDGPPG
jgi:FixJ family two-component response regulator